MEKRLDPIYEEVDKEIFTDREDAVTFLGAVDSLQKEHQLDALQGWVHARGGFTAEARERLRETGVLLTDVDHLRALVQEFHIA
jgi:hypothetical protein